jgi:hypothetical protein
MTTNDREPRQHLNAPLFEQPGQATGSVNRRTQRPRAKATPAADQRLPGRSMRAERAAADKAATPAPLTLASFAKFAQQAAAVEAQRAARTRKEQELTSGATDYKWVYFKGGHCEYRAYTDKWGTAFEQR